MESKFKETTNDSERALVLEKLEELKGNIPNLKKKKG
jgi:hypothetical protein